MTHTITIWIGDWSGDGHGRCEPVRFAANKPIVDVRAAYFAALAARPDLCPEKFCDGYEDTDIPEATMAALAAAGAPLGDIHGRRPTVRAMAAIVAWFIGLGDPELALAILPEEPSLHFYGSDDSGRHIGFIGYGLFV